MTQNLTTKQAEKIRSYERQLAELERAIREDPILARYPSQAKQAWAKLQQEYQQYLVDIKNN